MKSMKWFGIFALVAAFAFVGCESKKEDDGDKKKENAEEGAEGEGAEGEGGEGEEGEEGEGEAEDEGQSTEEIVAAAKAGEVAVGDSCKGLSAVDGYFSCSGQAVLFCSSNSKYVWTEFNSCKGEQVCVLSDDAKSTTCAAAEAADGEAPAEGEDGAAPADGDAAPAEGEGEAPAEGGE